MAEGVSNRTGLTTAEQSCMDYLVAAYNDFVKLEKQHPDEARDFTDSIHRLQDILAVRVLRRDYPDGWPSYKQDGK